VISRSDLNLRDLVKIGESAGYFNMHIMHILSIMAGNLGKHRYKKFPKQSTRENRDQWTERK